MPSLCNGGVYISLFLLKLILMCFMKIYLPSPAIALFSASSLLGHLSITYVNNFGYELVNSECLPNCLMTGPYCIC